MKEDSILFGVVFAVWATLATLYYTVPMIYMPTNARVWGLGAIVFLGLTVLAAIKGRAAQTPPESGD